MISLCQKEKKDKLKSTQEQNRPIKKEKQNQHPENKEAKKTSKGEKGKNK